MPPGEEERAEEREEDGAERPGHHEPPGRATPGGGVGDRRDGGAVSRSRREEAQWGGPVEPERSWILVGGDPARPEVSAAWDHAYIIDDRVTQSNKRGTLTFATAGPNTRTTQIFINYSDNAGLDGQGFSPFGQILEGMEVADKFFSGYGESPDQGRITAFGKAYLDKSFPNLDRIISAVVLPADAPAPAGDAKK